MGGRLFPLKGGDGMAVLAIHIQFAVLVVAVIGLWINYKKK